MSLFLDYIPNSATEVNFPRMKLLKQQIYLTINYVPSMNEIVSLEIT